MLKNLGNWQVIGGMGSVALMTVANSITDLVLGAIMVGLIYAGAKLNQIP